MDESVEHALLKFGVHDITIVRYGQHSAIAITLEIYVNRWPSVFDGVRYKVPNDLSDTVGVTPPPALPPRTASAPAPIPVT